MRRKCFALAACVSMVVLAATAGMWFKCFFRPGLVGVFGNSGERWYGVYCEYARTSWPNGPWEGDIALLKVVRFPEAVSDEEETWKIVHERRFYGFRMSTRERSHGGAGGMPVVVSRRESRLVMWLGWPFLLSLPLSIWGLWKLAVQLRKLPAKLRRWIASQEGCCTNCRYDLTGNVSGVCPECGKARSLARKGFTAPRFNGIC